MISDQEQEIRNWGRTCESSSVYQLLVMPALLAKETKGMCACENKNEMHSLSHITRNERNSAEQSHGLPPPTYSAGAQP